MLTANLGPLSMPIGVLLMFAGLLIAAGVGRYVGRSQKSGVGNILTDMLIAAVLVARIAFVAVWFDLYRSAPRGHARCPRRRLHPVGRRRGSAAAGDLAGLAP